MISVFKKLDILGQEVGFEENESTKFRTWQGSMLTLIVLVVCSTIGVLFGQEVYKRNQANVRYSKVLSENSYIDLTKLPFIFSISNKYGSGVGNILDYVTINFDIYSIDKAAKVSFTRETLKSNCDVTQLPNFAYVYNKNTKPDGNFCVDPSKNYNFTNNFGTSNSQFVHINFYPCDRKKRTCPDDMDALLSNFFMNLHLPNSYVESNSYAEPINYFLDAYAIQLSKSFYKRTFIAITNNTFISDNGWLLEDNKEELYHQISEVKTEVIAYSEGITPIGAFTLHSPRLGDRINRSYMKIQDLAAKLGGIINAMFIIINLLSYSYLRFLYLGNLYKLTKKVEEKATSKNDNVESSLSHAKINNYTTSNNNKLENVKIKLDKINAKEKNENAVNRLSLEQNKIHKINVQEINDVEIKFNYAKYLLSFVTCGSYHKLIDDSLKLTKDKMNIETLARAMNYFYHEKRDSY